jgi:5'-3' exonuclease
MKTNRPFLLIDSQMLCYQARHAYIGLSYNGEETGVIFGFLKKILDLAEIFNTNNIIFCWDSKFLYRKKHYPEYKIKRHNKKKELSEDEYEDYLSMLDQMNTVRDEVLPSMGFKNNFLADGFEADDLLAVWARKLFLKNQRAIIVTDDADLYQCLDHCSIYNPRKKNMFTRKLFEKKYGLTPGQWPLAKAIGGCSSDEVIGITGVSDPKKITSKALKYIKGDLTKGVILDRIKSKEGQEIIQKNLPIVTCPYKEEKLTRMILKRNKFSNKKFVSTFERYGFYSFLKSEKLNLWKRFFLNG